MDKHILDIILDFLKSIGIEVSLRPIESTTFLQGLQMENGTLVIDTEKLLYPGDILHEAGHLATMPPEIRANMSGNLEDNDLNLGGEIMAQAWSYAVSVHLGIDPHIVFHNDGYRGGSSKIISNFEQGYEVGLPLLQWTGMAYDARKAKELNALPFPNMIRWMREI